MSHGLFHCATIAPFRLTMNKSGCLQTPTALTASVGSLTFEPPRRTGSSRTRITTKRIRQNRISTDRSRSKGSKKSSPFSEKSLRRKIFRLRQRNRQSWTISPPGCRRILLLRWSGHPSWRRIRWKKDGWSFSSLTTITRFLGRIYQTSNFSRVQPI